MNQVHTLFCFLFALTLASGCIYSEGDSSGGASNQVTSTDQGPTTDLGSSKDDGMPLNDMAPSVVDAGGFDMGREPDMFMNACEKQGVECRPGQTCVDGFCVCEGSSDYTSQSVSYLASSTESNQFGLYFQVVPAFSKEREDAKKSYANDQPHFLLAHQVSDGIQVKVLDEFGRALDGDINEFSYTFKDARVKEDLTQMYPEINATDLTLLQSFWVLNRGNGLELFMLHQSTSLSDLDTSRWSIISYTLLKPAQSWQVLPSKPTKWLSEAFTSGKATSIHWSVTQSFGQDQNLTLVTFAYQRSQREPKVAYLLRALGNDSITQINHDAKFTSRLKPPFSEFQRVYQGKSTLNVDQEKNIHFANSFWGESTANSKDANQVLTYAKLDSALKSVATYESVGSDARMWPAQRFATLLPPQPFFDFDNAPPLLGGIDLFNSRSEDVLSVSFFGIEITKPNPTFSAVVQKSIKGSRLNGTSTMADLFGVDDNAIWFSWLGDELVRGSFERRLQFSKFTNKTSGNKSSIEVQEPVTLASSREFGELFTSLVHLGGTRHQVIFVKDKQNVYAYPLTREGRPFCDPRLTP